MDEATHFAIRTILEAMFDSGAVSEKTVREIVDAMRQARGTFGGDDDERISDALSALASGIERDVEINAGEHRLALASRKRS
jgi:hypothetical protein